MRKTQKKRKPAGRPQQPIKKRVMFGRPEDGLPLVYIDFDFHSLMHYLEPVVLDVNKAAAAIDPIFDMYSAPTPLSFLFANQ